jgi:predicted transglutaminase-like cysteine proteinase
MRISGSCIIVTLACSIALWAASPADALLCTPCQSTPPGPGHPTRTSDYEPINVIGGVKDVWGNMADLPKWDRVRRVIEADAIAADPRMRPWVTWAEGLRGQSLSERINAVNTRVNQRIRYMTDMEAQGVVDYWQEPLETVTLGHGDCEDYSILKYYLLLHAGLTREQLALVIGRIGSTGELHAVLVAESDRGWRLLDSRINQVIDLGGRADLSTIFFVDTNSVWVPVRRPAAR